MESTIKIKPIGKVMMENNRFAILIDEEYRAGLKSIEGFSHLQVVWWGNLTDAAEQRQQLMEHKPYVHGPDQLGVFATRSPVRPNPVLLTTIMVDELNVGKGLIYTPYIDAAEETPVLDLKPYHLMERVRDCSVPAWCRHWPQWYEDAGVFNWEEEFNFEMQ